ncbi:MAG TPA: FtsW/RodA/SpoVE family cell cycle protein [Candidatus Coprosoma intestinipullorum]|uniref:Probable peptidoglycan glycosyltransferase FtsW n=1 Tax=Candidatus Coprosoma intestinipullorum TaxID=2840752 RepID=A0A9D1CZN6_9FIRM|nr:FtsW/RodA/SpoVE family cell cycle protein [Candidatus Coprosoma intestinipullorum]
MQDKRSLRKIFHDLDKPLLFVSMALFIFGLLNIVTASSRAAVVNYDVSIYYYFYRQLLFIIIGLIMSLIIIKIDTKSYKIIIPALFVVVIILNLVALTGEELSGSKNWIDLGFIKLQPSEFSKPIIIVLMAMMFEKYYRKLRTLDSKRYNAIGIILFVSMIIPVLIFLQKDFGTLLITLFIVGMMLLASPILKIDKLKSFLLLIGIIALAGLIIYNVQGYILNDQRISRFKSYLDPCGNYENGGYQVCNSYIAINNGGLFGLGIGKSKQKYSYIPEPHTDSAFAIIAEEYGIYRCVFIFIGYIIVLWRILVISSKSNTLRGRYMCLGIASYIFVHIFVNLGGMLGLIPLTGVPLPFLSYGGSFVMSLIAALAIVQRVCVESKNQKEKIKIKQTA